MQRPYYRPKNKINCVLCKTAIASYVLFPCEHTCICDRCKSKEKFCSELELSKIPGGYSCCPICAGAIKLILPYENGNEIEKYWKWVYEIEVKLPTSFTRDLSIVLIL
jgi:hypothetical protein